MTGRVSHSGGKAPFRPDPLLPPSPLAGEGRGEGRKKVATTATPCRFTFQVPHLVDKNLRGRGIPEALPRGVVVSVNQVMKPLVGQGSQIGFAGQGAA